MIEKIKALFNKYRELISYLFFGVMTTLVNFVAFWLFGLVLKEELYLVSNALAWVVAVVFAYVTNKLFVFESKSWVPKILVKEIPEFVGARVFSFLIEEAGLWLMVDIMKMGLISWQIGFITINGNPIEISGQMIAKIILAVIVVILNYFFSKFIIFKKKKDIAPNTVGSQEGTQE